MPLRDYRQTSREVRKKERARKLRVLFQAEGRRRPKQPIEARRLKNAFYLPQAVEVLEHIEFFTLDMGIAARFGSQIVEKRGYPLAAHVKILIIRAFLVEWVVMVRALVLLGIFFSGLTAWQSVAAIDEPPFTIIGGDVLQITVWKEDGLDREVLVLPGGDITFPLIGTIKAQGKTSAELQADIKFKLKELIPDASVTVAVKAALGHTINVIGQVAKPGEIVIGRRTTVMQALSQAGGLTPFASQSKINVMRHGDNGDESIKIPYADIVSGDHLDKDIVLRSGDVVIVPTAGLF